MERHPSPGSRLRELGHDLVQDRQHRLGAERDDAGSRLQLGEEEHLVDQLPDLVDLVAGLVDELVHVLSRQARLLEQREQAGERGSQLVRHRGGEARAQLLVRCEVAGLGQVDEPLGPLPDRERDHDRRPPVPSGQKLVRHQLALAHLLVRLARTTAGGDDAVLVVEDDDRFAALLDEHPSA